jgi:hypothetical protein
MARTAVGYFRDRAAADAAYDALLQRGFARDDLSAVGRGSEGGGLADAPHDAHVTAGQGAAVGGLTGLLIGAAALMVPGLGPIIGVGPVIAALTGLVTGGIVGALIDAGLGEEAARYYDTRLREGGVLLAVRADDDRYGAAQAILQEHGADVHGEGSTGRGDVAQSAGASPGAPGFPDPRPRVGDDPGLIGTPVATPSGATATLDRPGADLDPRRGTTPTDDAPRPREPAAPRRSHGPPII